MKGDQPSVLLVDFFVQYNINFNPVIVYFPMLRELLSERIYEVTSINAINFVWLRTIN